MSSEEITRFLASLFGGGSVAVVGNWIYSNWSARRAREVEALREQLHLLYGPLFFLTSQNEELFKSTDKVRGVYDEYFVGKWSEDENTQNTLDKQAEATIELQNTYISRVVKNNDRVMDILERNWHLANSVDA